MKMNAFIIRATPYESDSRIYRIGELYKKMGYSVYFYIWGKENENKNIYSIVKFNKNKKIKSILLLQYIIFSFSVLLKLFKKVNNNDVIIFIDLESIFFAFILRYFKKIKIHFDIADPFHLSKVSFPSWFWIKLESFFAKKSNITTLTCQCRKKIYKKSLYEKFIVMENVPMNIYNFSVPIYHSEIYKVQIGYFGNLEKTFRGIEDLIDYVFHDDRVILHIAGTGELEYFIKSKSSQCNRINFYGKFDHTHLPNLMSKIDIYFSYYSPLKELHKYASPNKFYEHLLYAKPIIVSDIIPQSKLIDKYNTGWTISSINEISVIITEVLNNYSVLSLKSNNCKILWNNLYNNYYEDIKILLSRKLSG